MRNVLTGINLSKGRIQTGKRVFLVFFTTLLPIYVLLTVYVNTDILQLQPCFYLDCTYLEVPECLFWTCTKRFSMDNYRRAGFG